MMKIKSFPELLTFSAGEKGDKILARVSTWSSQLPALRHLEMYAAKYLNK